MNSGRLDRKPPSLSLNRHFNMTPPVFNELWEELLIKHGTCWAKVVSDSMYPVIKRGNQVLVEKADPDQVRFGDIVVFRRSGTLVTHRVIGKSKLGGEYHLLEKGDANLQSTLVPVKDVIGRITAIRNTVKTLPIISGPGRLLQLILACISYTSVKIWAILRFCGTGLRRTSHRRQYGAVYHSSFSLLRRIALRLFL